MEKVEQRINETINYVLIPQQATEADVRQLTQQLLQLKRDIIRQDKSRDTDILMLRQENKLLKVQIDNLKRNDQQEALKQQIMELKSTMEAMKEQLKQNSSPPRKAPASQAGLSSSSSPPSSSASSLSSSSAPARPSTSSSATQPRPSYAATITGNYTRPQSSPLAVAPNPTSSNNGKVVNSNNSSGNGGSSNNDNAKYRVVIRGIKSVRNNMQHSKKNVHRKVVDEYRLLNEKQWAETSVDWIGFSIKENDKWKNHNSLAVLTLPNALAVKCIFAEKPSIMDKLAADQIYISPFLTKAELQLRKARNKGKHLERVVQEQRKELSGWKTNYYDVLQNDTEHKSNRERAGERDDQWTTGQHRMDSEGFTQVINSRQGRRHDPHH